VRYMCICIRYFKSDTRTTFFVMDLLYEDLKTSTRSDDI